MNKNLRVIDGFSRSPVRNICQALASDDIPSKREVFQLTQKKTTDELHWKAGEFARCKDFIMEVDKATQAMLPAGSTASESPGPSA